MVRTRKSLPLSAGKPPGQALAGPTATNLNTRRQSLRNRVSVAASETASSVPSPAGYSSASEYSTPLTSNVATPAPSVPGTSLKSTRTRSSTTKMNMEISISSKKQTLAKDSVKTLSKSKFSLTSSKRKRDEIADSEDDYDSDASPDAKLARRLQDAIDQQEVGEFLAQVDPPAASGRASRGRPSIGTPRSVAGPSTRKGSVMFDPIANVAGTAARVSRQTIKKPAKLVGKTLSAVLVDSDDDVSYAEDDNDSDKWSTIAASRPGRKRQGLSSSSKAASGKGKTKAIDVVDASDDDDDDEDWDEDVQNDDDDDDDGAGDGTGQGDEDRSAQGSNRQIAARRQYRRYRSKKRTLNERDRLEKRHPILTTMWEDLQSMPVLKAGAAEQPRSISRILKGFQLEGLAWMMAMEKTKWKGGLLGDEMGLGKTIQAVSLIMSDYPAKKPTLVLAPPVALMQWTSEIESYTDGRLNTIVFHGTNSKTKNMTTKDIKKFDVIIMSYNSLESMYRKQEKGFSRKDGVYKEKSMIHATHFHRVILDEAHSIKTRTTMTAKACFALQVDYRWCLSGTPLQNRIGEFFSLIRFLEIRPFASYFCRDCTCTKLEWSMNEDNVCPDCNHRGMRHISVFNQELLNPIQRYGNRGPGAEAFAKLRLMTDRIMLRRLKKDHTDSMELPVKEINVDRQFFGEEENDFANSIMTSGQRKFDTYVAQGVLLNNYANIFGLIMQMRQVADHPDLILKKNSEGGQNVLVCCICDEPAEDAIRSRCKHDFCRECAKGYLAASSAEDSVTKDPDCPRCHIPLAIDLEQVEIEQDENLVKKSSIINRIKMENWTSSSKIELLVHDLHRLRKDNASHKSIIFSQFTTMLQLIEWRLRRAGITTVMLDGSMTPAQRAASIDHFMKNTDVECFLVSLKAGGVALNLTEASRVFIVDPWWNPAAEWQSADRCHRIGQTRPCTITRLCIEDSVESRMVMLQEKKTKMINSTINSDDAAMESLSPEDLQFLFRGT